MNDLVSRQAAIDALDGVMFPEDPFRTWAKVAIRSVPPAQQWIPCSERLPEVNERCLCTYEFNEGTCVDFGLYTKRGWFVSGVTAWMPLPEPYKEERSEE